MSLLVYSCFDLFGCRPLCFACSADGERPNICLVSYISNFDFSHTHALICAVSATLAGLVWTGCFNFVIGAVYHHQTASLNLRAGTDRQGFASLLVSDLAGTAPWHNSTASLAVWVSILAQAVYSFRQSLRFELRVRRTSKESKLRPAARNRQTPHTN